MSLNTDFIPFARPQIGRQEQQAALRVLKSGWLTTGAEAAAFEKEFAAFTGLPHALAVNSATAGLHLALEALRIRPGDRVMVPAYTFAASAEVIRYLGAHPWFVDIEQESLNISPATIASSLAADSDPAGCAALIAVHLAGRPAPLTEIAAQWPAGQAPPIVEDAAHAFPVQSAEGFLGALGRIGVYSFYATKTLTTGEGGMVVTKDERLARRIEIMRLHGIDRPVWNRYRDNPSAWQYDLVAAGFKYNMADLNAAIGREQLKKAKTFLSRRQTIAALYHKALADCAFLRLPTMIGQHAWHLYIVRIKPRRLKISRDQFIDQLKERGVGASVHYKPLPLMSYYRKKYKLNPKDFPHSVEAFEQAISLPIYPGLTDSQIERIVSIVQEVGKRHLRSPVNG